MKNGMRSIDLEQPIVLIFMVIAKNVPKIDKPIVMGFHLMIREAIAVFIQNIQSNMLYYDALKYRLADAMITELEICPAGTNSQLYLHQIGAMRKRITFARFKKTADVLNDGDAYIWGLGHIW